MNKNNYPYELDIGNETVTINNKSEEMEVLAMVENELIRRMLNGGDE
jgi:hypothetical protein